jgi:hypothetical protein
MRRSADALAELEADIVFVQEVGLERHREELARRAQSRFPHVFRPKPAIHATASCADAELEPLASCARTHCDGLRDGRLGECVVRSCASAAMSMSTDCLNCVLRNPFGTMEEILAPCRGATKSGGGEAADFGDVHLFGTHLSPGVVHEQREQIEALLAWIDAKAEGKPTLLLGDLNTGPSSAHGISARSRDEPWRSYRCQRSMFSRIQGS